MKAHIVFAPIAPLCVLFILFLGTKTVQAKYLPGYIILPSTDTLQGQIDYRSWDRSPSQIDFQSFDGRTENFPVARLKEFGVAGEIYRSFSVSLNLSPFETKNLTQDPSPKWESVTIALQLIVGGPKSLYYHRDKQGKRHFFIQEQIQTPEELVFHRYLVIKGKSAFLKENKLYISQVGEMLTDCKVIFPRLKEMPFSLSAFRDLFILYYNDCSYSDIDYLVQKRVGTHQAVVKLGIARSTIHFGGDIKKHQGLVQGVFSPAFSPTFDLGYIFFPARTQNRIGLALSISGRYQQHNASSEVIFSELETLNQQTDLALSYLKFNSCVYFKWPENSLRPFIITGLSNGRMLSFSQSSQVRREIRNIVREFEQLPIEKVTKLEQAFLLGGGIHIPNTPFCFELRYEISTGPSGLPSLSSPIQTWSCMMGYSLPL